MCICTKLFQGGAEKEYGIWLERQRRGMFWTLAWKRAIQSFTTMAKTRLALRQRRMLVVVWPPQNIFAADRHVAHFEA